MKALSALKSFFKRKSAKADPWVSLNSIDLSSEVYWIVDTQARKAMKVAQFRLHTKSVGSAQQNWRKFNFKSHEVAAALDVFKNQPVQRKVARVLIARTTDEYFMIGRSNGWALTHRDIDLMQ